MIPNANMDAATDPKTVPATVRVTAIRRGRFVEFDYSVGDPDLSVELIMPLAAFEEFRRRDGVVTLPPAEDVGTPDRPAGLLRRPEADPETDEE